MKEKMRRKPHLFFAYISSITQQENFNKIDFS